MMHEQSSASLCARDKIKASNAEATIPGLKVIGSTEYVDLKSLGCTSWSSLISRKYVLNLRDEDFSSPSALSLSLPLILALAISFGVYGLMSAKGRVIGGFAAS
jgi:hypothetical protein